MNNYFIILASGLSKRFKSNKPKQFSIYKNKQLFEHSLDKAINSKLFKKIILVVKNKKELKKKYPDKVHIINGGKERSDSSLKAINYIKKFNPTNVLIHDGARPNFSNTLLINLIKNLKNSIAVIPTIQSVDSIKYKINNQTYNLDRNKCYLTQTPQAFNFKKLYTLALKEKNKVKDEATLFINKDLPIKFIRGEIKNKKITFNNEIKENKTYYGLGFDIHRLIRNKKLYLGGTKISFHSGLKGHSDGDVILHAIIDAILGAMRKKDIGFYFPNNNKFKNIRSPKMLKPILSILNKNNFYLNNLDINLICEKPKVSLYRNKIIKSLSRLLTVDENLINLKGKTVEKLGLIGNEEAIACEVIVSLNKYD